MTQTDEDIDFISEHFPKVLNHMENSPMMTPEQLHNVRERLTILKEEMESEL